MVRAVPLDDERRSRRRLVLLLVLLVTTGSCGVSSGIGAVQPSPPGAQFVAPSDNPVWAAAEEQLADVAGPLRRVLGGANIVVSALLLVAGWAVATGRHSRVWWVTQAALANAVWVGLDVGSTAFGLLKAKKQLMPAIEKLIKAQPAPPPKAAAWAPDPHSVLYGYIVLMILLGLVRVAVFGAMIVLARRLPEATIRS